MNKQKKPSFFATIIAFAVFVTILGPLLEVLTGIIIILVIGSLIYFICKFLKQQQQKNTDTTTTVLDETEKQHQDYLFYGNFIKSNTLQKPTLKNVPEVHSVVSFELKNSVDFFDQNFLKVFAYAETYNTIQSQNKFLDSYFDKVFASEDLSTDVKTRANHAKEYVALVQGIKETLHFIKASQTGYTDDSYYFFINSKETSGFVDSMNEHEWTENTPIRHSLNVERKKRENDMTWVAKNLSSNKLIQNSSIKPFLLRKAYRIIHLNLQYFVVLRMF